MLANVNRDPKGRKQPFDPSDFYCYAPADGRNKPRNRYLDAYAKLVESRQLPSWALFIYESMKGGVSKNAPDIHYLIGDNFLLLAPSWDGNTIKGMIISLERERGQIELVDPAGKKYRCLVGETNTKVEATEEGEVQVLS